MSYTPFTRKQVEEALPNGWEISNEPANVGEIVYKWQFRNKLADWTLKCFSGLQKGRDISRARGKDAIRFVLFDSISGRPVGKTTRVHRTGDVASLTERMLQRARQMADLARSEEPKRCYKCGAATVDRVNRSSGESFRGCLRWRECG